MGRQEKLSLQEKKGDSRTSETHDVQLVWPTYDFVVNSIDGIAAGYSLCFPEKNLKPFMKNYFHTFKPSHSSRISIPPHLKVILPSNFLFIPDNFFCYKSYCRYNDESMGWCCISSSNLSCAAWGQLQKNQTQLAIRNFEIGLLYIPSDREKKSFQINQGEVNLPYEIPPKLYNWEKERPWTWDEFSR